MAILRIEKNKDFTVMSKYHFNDKNLSWQAKGMLGTMLSLPDNQEYTADILMELSTNGQTSVCSILKELEKNGYLKRERVYKDGIVIDWEYLIREIPSEKYKQDYAKKIERKGQKKAENHLELENQDLGNQDLENPEILYNTNNINKLNNKNNSKLKRICLNNNISNTLVNDVYSKSFQDNVLAEKSDSATRQPSKEENVSATKGRKGAAKVVDEVAKQNKTFAIIEALKRFIATKESDKDLVDLLNKWVETMYEKKKPLSKLQITYALELMNEIAKNDKEYKIEMIKRATLNEYRDFKHLERKQWNNYSQKPNPLNHGSEPVKTFEERKAHFEKNKTGITF